MKKILPLSQILFLNLLLFGSFISQAQTDPPENLYVTPVGMASWDSITSNDFQFYKVFLNGAFVADTDSTAYQFGANGEELISGETYLAEIAALYNDGLSEKVGFEFVYLPCDSFPNYNSMEAYNLAGTDDVVVSWSDLMPMELIVINQGYGDPGSALYQNYGHGYGVSFDFSSYPDALVHSVDFRHSSWGVYGSWDYMIHIVNRDDNTLISSIGPFQTTGDDTWEEMIELGDIATNGANEVAILMEPMGNVPTDAYPCLDADNAEDPQGSILGDLNDLNSFNPSTEGNFLLNVYIYTSNNGKSTTEFIGTNIYLDDELIAFVPEPDTFYIIQGYSFYGYHDICVDKVYTNDNGNHSWTSCYGELCVFDIGTDWPCNPPENLIASEDYNYEYILLSWNTPEDAYIPGNELIGYNIYRDGFLINNTPYYDTAFLHYTSQGMYCYEITAIYPNCESDPSNEVCVDFFDWIDEVDFTLNIKPNPAQNSCRIQSTKLISNIKIYNQLGQLCSNFENIATTSFQINLSQLESGIYFIEIRNESKIQKSKLIIN